MPGLLEARNLGIYNATNNGVMQQNALAAQQQAQGLHTYAQGNGLQNIDQAGLAQQALYGNRHGGLAAFYNLILPSVLERPSCEITHHRDADFISIFDHAIAAGISITSRQLAENRDLAFERVRQFMRGVPVSPPQADPQIALKRSKSLLIDALSREQLKDFALCGQFTVLGSKSKKPYRIKEGTAYNVSVEGEGEYCAPASHGHGVPVYDSMLAQKVTIELDEPAFLKVANHKNHRTVRVVNDAPQAANVAQWGNDINNINNNVYGDQRLEMGYRYLGLANFRYEGGVVRNDGDA